MPCEDVPLRWRRIYAIAVYTYGRAGEQAALQFVDVDLQARAISICKQLNSKTGKVTHTKEKSSYRIPIEPSTLR